MAMFIPEQVQRIFIIIKKLKKKKKNRSINLINDFQNQEKLLICVWLKSPSRGVIKSNVDVVVGSNHSITTVLL